MCVSCDSAGLLCQWPIYSAALCMCHVTVLAFCISDPFIVLFMCVSCDSAGLLYQWLSDPFIVLLYVCHVTVLAFCICGSVTHL